MRSFFSKFKFKWWSWEIDAVKILPALLIVSVFLPVLPYEKKDGKLVSVLGFEARNNNIYLDVKDFYISEKELEKMSEEKKQKILSESLIAQIGELYSQQELDFEKYKQNIDSLDIKDDLKGCILVRDLLMSSWLLDSEARRLLRLYVPSPVPSVWIARALVSQVLVYISTPSYEPGVLVRSSNKCKNFKNIWPSAAIFEFAIKKNSINERKLE